MAESEDSVRAQVQRLDIGQSVAKAYRVAGTDSFPGLDINGISAHMRKTLDGAVHRVRRRLPERDYTVETGQFFTRSGALTVVAMVTRVS